MKKLVLVPLLVLLAPSISGCKKSDSADGASAAASAESPQGGALAAFSALKGFEGEITVAVKSEKERKPTPPITVTVKGAKIRFDVPEGIESGSARFGEKAHMIVDAPGKRLLAVVDDKKQVVVIGLDMMSEQMKSFAAHMPGQAPHAEEAPSKVEKTGKTDTVAGYKCEEWNVTSAKGERAQICVASEDASWFELPTLNLPTEHAWAKELFDGHHFPLRLVSYDAAGGEKDRIEVTKLEKKSIADSVFEPPAGYQMMDMGAMMRSMMGGGLPPGMMPQGMPGAMPAGAPGSPPPGLPPGMQLPPGVQLPKNMQMPANAAEMMKQMQDRARAAGVRIPQQPPPPAH